MQFDQPPTAANWLNVTEIGEFPARHEGEEDRRRCIRSDYFKEAGSRRCLTFREVASRVILHPFRFRPRDVILCIYQPAGATVNNGGARITYLRPPEDDPEGGPIMRFRLTYEGELRANGRDR